MSTWIALARAEALKLKRSLALLVVAAAPVLTTLLYFLVMMKDRKGVALAQPWENYAHIVLSLWSFLALPMLATLLATLVNGVEHQNGMWKHLFAQPVPRWRILAVKAAASLVLLGFACFLLLPCMAIFGKLLHMLKPGLGFGAPIPLRSLALAVARPFFAAWLMLALHQWISQRSPSMTLSLGSGMLGLIGAFVVVNSDRWGPLYPWCLALRATQPGPAPMGVMILGVGGGLLIWALACWDGSRRG
ncbi:MAG TPA: ABC transporter permease [Holophagaceae bacterium]|nr:ABC transporter permease [Holophagaceae bacterium]